MAAVTSPAKTIRIPKMKLFDFAKRPIQSPRTKRNTSVMVTEIRAAVMKSKGNNTRGIRGRSAAGSGDTP